MSIDGLSFPTQGPLVVLYELDLTKINSDKPLVFRVAPYSDAKQSIFWGGKEYTSIPIEADGFELSGQGSFPRPRLKIANIQQLFGGLIVQYNDLLGCEVRRYRTFAKHLDAGTEPSRLSHFPVDVYRIDRKIAHNKIYIEWELSAAIDQQGTYLPRRQLLKNICTQSYRFWNKENHRFEYFKSTCPYSGDASFDEFGNSVSADFDACGKKLSDCKLRFKNNPMPFNGFPGLDELR